MRHSLSWPASTPAPQDKTLKSLIAQLRQFTNFVIYKDKLQADLPQTFNALQTGEKLRKLSLYSEQDLIASHKIVASCASIMADEFKHPLTISVMYRIKALEEYIKACHLEQKCTLTYNVASNNYNFLTSTAHQLSNQLLLWDSSEPSSREATHIAQILDAIDLVPPTFPQAYHALQKARRFIATHYHEDSNPKVASSSNKVVEDGNNVYGDNTGGKTHSIASDHTFSSSDHLCDTEVEETLKGEGSRLAENSDYD